MHLVECAECGDPIYYIDYMPWPVADALLLDEDDTEAWRYRVDHAEHEPTPDPEWVPRCDFFCCAYDW